MFLTVAFDHGDVRSENRRSLPREWGVEAGGRRFCMIRKFLVQFLILLLIEIGRACSVGNEQSVVESRDGERSDAGAIQAVVSADVFRGEGDPVLDVADSDGLAVGALAVADREDGL